jgi:hypothetical protein
LSNGVPGSTSSGILSDTRKLLGLFSRAILSSSLMLPNRYGPAEKEEEDSHTDESRLVSISSAELSSYTGTDTLVTDTVLDSTEDLFCFFT